MLPDYQGQGLGSALVRSLLEQLGGLYMVDLTCDKEVQPFYARQGMRPSVGMMLRRYDCKTGRSGAQRS